MNSVTFFNNKTKGQQHQFLSNLLADALFDNCWATADIDDDDYNTYHHDNDCTEDVWARALMNYCPLYIYDHEDSEEHEITLTSILRALDQCRDEEPKVWARVISEDGSADCYDCDAILQYAVFEEWIYG